MANYLDLEPDELRRLAQQHDAAAARVRKWGKIPRAWLDDFERIQGTIADPMRRALEDYYQRRHDKAERQAERHERTRDNLLDAAQAMEENDRNSAGTVAGAGNFDSGPMGSGGSAGPVATSAPRTGIGPAVPVVGTSPGRTNSAGQVAAGPMGPSPGASRVVPLGQISAIAPHDPARPVQSEPWKPDDRAVSGRLVVPENTAPVASPAIPSSVTTPTRPESGAVGATGAAVAGPVSADGRPVPSASERRLPAPLPSGPLAAVAVRTAVNSLGLPSLVVGDQVDDDLVLARNILGATLAAVGDSQPTLEWAVMVLRTSGGPLVMLTTNEGRGWLPPGLFLPVEVTIPWKWDARIGRSVRQLTARLEGVADPARVLAEMGRGFRPGHSRITALVASTVIADHVQEALRDETALAERVPAAAAATNFASPGVGLTDRLGVGGSDRLLQQADAVTESEIWSTCLGLAMEVDARIRAALPSSDEEILSHRSQRQQFFESLERTRSVPNSWVDDMLANDAMKAAAQRSRRVDISQVAFGACQDHPEADALRSMAFERRADEMLLLLAGAEPNRQILRDLLYAYGQVVEHPLFPAAAPTTVKGGPGVGGLRAAVTPHMGLDVPRVGTAVRGTTAISGADMANEPAELVRKGGLHERFGR